VKIFPRENEGLRYLTCFTKGNTEKKYDIVLQNEGYDLANIFSDENIFFKEIEIDNNSVGIFPSIRIFERTTPEKFNEIYDVLINRLIAAKKKIYVLRFAYEDLLVCKNIKKLFPDNNDVKLIQDDLNCIELENIIKRFDFVIASRYHSIIHSYKNGVPALVIGWATKYRELLKTFSQQDYLFDVRNSIEPDKINTKLETLLNNYNQESEEIRRRHKQILSERSVFDCIVLDQ
jgi:colanic acid/amylovoran biosynthesis protein